MRKKRNLVISAIFAFALLSVLLLHTSSNVQGQVNGVSGAANFYTTNWLTPNGQNDNNKNGETKLTMLIGLSARLAA